MNNETPKQCKTKSCNNPVLKGKYCEYCKQKGKETNAKIFAGVGGTVLGGVGIFAIIKKFLKYAARIVK